MCCHAFNKDRREAQHDAHAAENGGEEEEERRQRAAAIRLGWYEGDVGAVDAEGRRDVDRRLDAILEERHREARIRADDPDAALALAVAHLGERLDRLRVHHRPVEGEVDDDEVGGGLGGRVPRLEDVALQARSERRVDPIHPHGARRRARVGRHLDVERAPVGAARRHQRSVLMEDDAMALVPHRAQRADERGGAGTLGAAEELLARVRLRREHDLRECLAHLAAVASPRNVTPPPASGVT